LTLCVCISALVPHRLFNFSNDLPISQPILFALNSFSDRILFVLSSLIFLSSFPLFLSFSRNRARSGPPTFDGIPTEATNKFSYDILTGQWVKSAAQVWSAAVVCVKDWKESEKREKVEALIGLISVKEKIVNIFLHDDFFPHETSDFRTQTRHVNTALSFPNTHFSCFSPPTAPPPTRRSRLTRCPSRVARSALCTI
jgi:hypothetical protein